MTFMIHPKPRVLRNSFLCSTVVLSSHTIVSDMTIEYLVVGVVRSGCYN